LLGLIKFFDFCHSPDLLGKEPIFLPWAKGM
jgi:hypothetical protein